MNKFSVTVTIDDPAWESPHFERALAQELTEVAKVFVAERDRREAARREAFWQDLGRPADAHIGAVGGE